MYTSFFGLNEKPFSITPDPRYLFMSARHGEALAHLVYGVTESGGFMQLTGEVGTGKTTLVRTLLQNRLPANADVAIVLNPQLSALEFLQTIGEELGVPEPPEKNSIKAMIDALNAYLLKAHADGRRTILVVDEAQNLSRDVLEQVRLLTNLETSKQKLLQIVLIGQPELRELLARNDLRQLAQRITGRYHLEPLTRDETELYIDHRMQVAGAVGETFESRAKREVFRLSQGVPRLINVICDRALLGAYGSEARRVNRRMVQRAAAEISGRTWTSPGRRWLLPAAAAAGVALLAVGAWALYSEQRNAIAPAAGKSATALVAGPAKREEPAETASPPVPAGTDPAPPRVPAGTDATPATARETTLQSTTLDEELILASDLTDGGTALAVLSRLWGVASGEEPRSCEQALDYGFECVQQRGSWNSLQQYDRPAVLTLIDSNGGNHHVVLAAVREETAQLLVGGVDVVHPVDDVSDLWFGQFLLLWRPANGSSIALGPGLVHPNVAWLRESLAMIDDRYRAEPLSSETYDATLEARVRDFQRDYRLQIDGLAGRQTQIIVNSLTADGGVPRLAAPGLAEDEGASAQRLPD